MFIHSSFACGIMMACLGLVQPPLSAASQNDAGIIDLETDLLIVGATESGWAAAIQACRSGVGSVVIVHDGKWYGGQFTEQALACVDENKGVGKEGWGVDWHPMKRSFHRSGLFKELMDRIERFNLEKYGSRMPGRPYHGPSTYRPAEAEAIFREMIQPYVDAGRIRVFWDRCPVRADIVRSGGREALRGLWFRPVSVPESDHHTADLHVRAQLTIDASDWGDAIQKAGADFECGPDPRSRYSEPSAPETLKDNPPNEMNPITWAMIIEETDQDHSIPKPTFHDDRNFVRSSRLSLAEMSGLDWDRPVRLGSILHWPDGGKVAGRQLSVYTVRRLIEGTTSRKQQTVILLNYMLGQDYPLERLPERVVRALEADESGASLKNIVRMTRQQRAIIFADARHQALSLLFHMQNFVHERASDRSHSLRRFRLSREFGTPDDLPPKPYIRESLRLKAMYMMREQDGRNADGLTKTLAREKFARVMYPDGVLAWQFHYDFHRTGRAYLRKEGTTGPWIDYEKPGRHTHHVSDRGMFPLRSLVPQQMDGLLGAQKNVGYSSIVCAAIRLHDQCVAIGQAAGATAAVALLKGVEPRELPHNPELLADVREQLCPDRADYPGLLIWPFRDLAPHHPAYAAINLLASRGGLPLNETEIDFEPEKIAEPQWRRQVVELSLRSKQAEERPEPPSGSMTRGEFCRKWWMMIRNLPERPWDRLADDDADADGIPDLDDPTPFDPGNPVVWSLGKLLPTEDGLPDSLQAADGIRRFHFAGQSTPEVKGFLRDRGLVFAEDRGFGWTADLSANHRQRGVYPEPLRDAFLFTRDAARWECRVSNGRFRVTVCAGDSGYDQTGHRVTIEGQSLIKDEPTRAGAFLERSADVMVQDGRLTVDLGPQQPGRNTTINWLLIEPLLQR